MNPWCRGSERMLLQKENEMTPEQEPVYHVSPENRDTHPQKETSDSLMAYCRENGRVCPQPMKWNELWEMLPDRRRRGHGWEPAPPLILAAWHEAGAIQKMFRLADHIKWARSHNALPAIAAFLRSLREEDWHHLGE